MIDSTVRAILRIFSNAVEKPNDEILRNQFTKHRQINLILELGPFVMKKKSKFEVLHPTQQPHETGHKERGHQPFIIWDSITLI